jgi:hypothetical protein
MDLLGIALVAYIILHGRSSWASLNTYYSVLKNTESRPDLIWVCTESIYENDLAPLIEGITIISLGYDFNPKIRTTVLPEGDIVEAGLEIGGLVNSLKQEYRVSLDITSARKALVAGALLSTTDNKPDHIYYLKIDTLSDISKPYPLIPEQHHELIDFRAETRRPRL